MDPFHQRMINDPCHSNKKFASNKKIQLVLIVKDAERVDSIVLCLCLRGPILCRTFDIKYEYSYSVIGHFEDF